MDIPSQHEDLKDLIMGRELGHGIHRRVFVFAPDPRLVIKCAVNDPKANILEYEFWETFSEAKGVAEWLAPCVGISACGMFLLQKRVETKPKSDYPSEVLRIFSDLKYSNFGWLDGRFVCCDYAGFFTSAASIGLLRGKMKKAEWWDDI